MAQNPNAGLEVRTDGRNFNLYGADAAGFLGNLADALAAGRLVAGDAATRAAHGEIYTAHPQRDDRLNSSEFADVNNAANLAIAMLNDPKCVAAFRGVKVGDKNVNLKEAQQLAQQTIKSLFDSYSTLLRRGNDGNNPRNVIASSRVGSFAGGVTFYKTFFDTSSSSLIGYAAAYSGIGVGPNDPPILNAPNNYSIEQLRAFTIIHEMRHITFGWSHGEDDTIESYKWNKEIAEGCRGVTKVK